MLDDPFTDPPAVELADGGWFTDPPALPQPQGLQHGNCRDCGGPALVDAQYAGHVRCSACWSRLHGRDRIPVPPRGALARVVVVPRIVRGELSAPRGTSEPRRFKSAHSCRICGRWLEGEWSRADTVEREQLQRQMDAGICDGCAEPIQSDDEAAPGRFRVVTPARPADGAEIAPGAATLAQALAAYDPASGATITYALAEDLKLARLLETCAVRVPHVGYAMWERAGDGSWRTRAAQIADPYLRSCSVTEFTALATGKPWTPPAPPIKGPCPRCSTPDHPVIVRWRKDPMEPYAHNRPSRPKEPKIKCLPPPPLSTLI